MTTHILVTTAGEVQPRTGPVTYETVRKALGAWPDMVRLRAVPDRMAWVDGDGHPKGLDYNVVGTLLCGLLYGPETPLAGPVVLTGWDCYDPEGEVEPIPAEGAEPLEALARSIRQALHMEAGTPELGAEWAIAVRKAAGALMGAPRPGIHVVDPSEVKLSKGQFLGYGPGGEVFTSGEVLDLGDVLGEQGPRGHS